MGVAAIAIIRFMQHLDQVSGSDKQKSRAPIQLSGSPETIYVLIYTRLYGMASMGDNSC